MKVGGGIYWKLTCQLLCFECSLLCSVEAYYANTVRQKLLRSDKQIYFIHFVCVCTELFTFTILVQFVRFCLVYYANMPLASRLRVFRQTGIQILELGCVIRFWSNIWHGGLSRIAGAHCEWLTMNDNDMVATVTVVACCSKHWWVRCMCVWLISRPVSLSMLVQFVRFCMVYYAIGCLLQQALVRQMCVCG